MILWSCIEGFTAQGLEDVGLVGMVPSRFSLC